MLFAIVGTDVPDSLPLRQLARPAHLERLEQLAREGRLVLAGPFPRPEDQSGDSSGFTGSLIVADFENIDLARQWAEADPYRLSGVYADVSVKPFKQVFPK